MLFTPPTNMKPVPKTHHADSNRTVAINRSSQNRLINEFPWVLCCVCVPGAAEIPDMVEQRRSLITPVSGFCSIMRAICQNVPLDSRRHVCTNILRSRGRNKLCWVKPGSVFYLLLIKVWDNERGCYICNVFSHWLRHCPVIDRKQAQMTTG